MQNILNAKDVLIQNKVFLQKFFIDRDGSTRINMIDVNDFGYCVAKIISDPQYQYSTLELCGPENLSASEMLSAMEKVIGYTIELKYITDDVFRESMSERNASAYSIETLLKMFKHYNNGDFCGSAFTVSAILRKTPVTFIEFLNSELK